MIKMQKAYICSPLSAATVEGIAENMKKARCYMKFIGNLLGCRAVAPHGYMPEFIDEHDPVERKLALDFGFNYLSTCDIIVVCGDIISEGMRLEIKRAEELNIRRIDISLSANKEGA